MRPGPKYGWASETAGVNSIDENSGGSRLLRLRPRLAIIALVVNRRGVPTPISVLMH